MEDLKHGLLVTFICPGCKIPVTAKAINHNDPCLSCGTIVHIQRHPNGRITVQHDPTQEAK